MARRSLHPLVIVFVAIGLALLHAPTPTRAQTTEPKGLPGLPLGTRVVQKFKNTKLRRGDTIVPGQKDLLHAYRVIDSDDVLPGGPWVKLQVEGQGLLGWLTARDVVPIADAIGFFTAQIAADSNDAWNYQIRGWLWHREHKEYDLAIKDLNEALRLSPSAPMFNGRGHAWYAKQNYDKAIADFNEAIRLDPALAAIFLNRGTAWKAKNVYEKAIADYNEAIRLDPADANAFYNRGNAWSDTKDYDKAIADYNEAIRLDPAYAHAFIRRGYTWYTIKDFDKAIADYSEAIRLDPADANAFYNRGDAWRAKNDYENAIADFTKHTELNPSDPCAYGQIATCWYEKGDYSRAIKWHTKALEENENHNWSRGARALNNALLGHADEAARDYSEFLARSKDGSDLNGIAWILATLPKDNVRDGKRAIELATKACELSEWKTPTYIDTLAAALAETGDFDAAVIRQEEAIKKLPADAPDRAEYEAKLNRYRDRMPFRAE